MSPGGIDTCWQVVEDEAELREIAGILDRLDDTLRRERKAVADLDPMALNRVGQEKERAAGELQAMIDRIDPALSDPMVTVVRRDDMGIRALRLSVRDRLRSVRASAAVNATLLQETADAVAEALGLRSETTTYDERARKRSQHARFTAKAA